MYLDRKKLAFSLRSTRANDDSNELYYVMTYGKHKNAFLDLYRQFMT